MAAVLSASGSTAGSIDIIAIAAGLMYKRPQKVSE